MANFESPTPQWHVLESLAAQEIESVLGGLPHPLACKAMQLPIVLESRPNSDLLAEGMEPDTLGVFVGEAFPDGEAGGMELPPRIALFLDNLWEFAGADESVFRHEVRTTLLHELGHYLGLTENDLEERGLD